LSIFITSVFNLFPFLTLNFIAGNIIPALDSLIIHQDALNFNAIFMTLENYYLKRPAQAVPAPGAFLRKQMVYCCDSAC